MFLVHETKNKTGKWQVAWMWLPHFLAADPALHKYVGQKMTETFKGQVVDEDPARRNHFLLQAHNEAIRLILEKYPIPGLRQYLESTIHLNPEEGMPE